MTNEKAPRIWTIPIVLGVVTTACLVVALVDDDIWDVAASAGLAAILAFATYKGITTRG